MRRTLRLFVFCVAAVVSLPSFAQNTTQPLFGQSDLDQMLAPIALYPDDLLSNVLAAATYPLEVVQVDRFVKQNPNLQGDALAAAMNNQPWDTSVKSLAQFPSVLAMMDDQLSWTQQLGDAFLAQQGAVMDTVQNLRAKAEANGTLQSDTQQAVVVEGGNIDIQPQNPDVVYVPYYDPNIVYGIWWWPSQQPVLWNPPPRFRPNAFGNIGLGTVVFGPRVTVSGANFNRFRPNWGAHTVTVDGARRGNQTGDWHHDPAHRGGVAYRSTPSINLTRSPPVARGTEPVRPHQAQQQTPQYQQYPQPALQQNQQQVQQRAQPQQQFHPAEQPVRPVATPVQPMPHPEPVHQAEPARAAPAPAAPAHGEPNHNSNDTHKQNNN